MLTEPLPFLYLLSFTLSSTFEVFDVYCNTIIVTAVLPRDLIKQQTGKVEGVFQRSSQMISLRFCTNYSSYSYFCILRNLSYSRIQIQHRSLSLYFVKYVMYGKHLQIKMKDLN